MNQQLCSYCQTRPLLARRGSRTCGEAGCRREHNRVITRARNRERRAALPGAERQDTTCAACGAGFAGYATQRFCSVACANRSRAAGFRPVATPSRGCRVCGAEYVPDAESVGAACSVECARARRASPRYDLQRAWAVRDYVEFTRLLRHYSTQTVDGCWEWPRVNGRGYPTASFARKNYGLHRMALEARLMRPLGVDQAHHICATAACVNPAHLQPISARENIAEMHQRNVYLARIAELEAELRRLDPESSLLPPSEVGEAQ